MDAKYLLTKITEIDSVYGNKFKYILKSHPDYNAETLKSTFNFENINAKVLFTDKDIYSLNSSICVNAVISMSSSIIVESASLGLPTIILFNPNSLTYDPFEKESWINVAKSYSNADLISALDRFISIDDITAQNYQKEGVNIQNAHFSTDYTDDLSAYVY